MSSLTKHCRNFSTLDVVCSETCHIMSVSEYYALSRSFVTYRSFYFRKTTISKLREWTNIKVLLRLSLGVFHCFDRDRSIQPVASEGFGIRHFPPSLARNLIFSFPLYHSEDVVERKTETNDSPVVRKYGDSFLNEEKEEEEEEEEEETSM